LKKEYIAPAICVENVKLSAFCDAGGCTISPAHKQEIADKYVQSGAGEYVGGTFYCYFSSADIVTQINSMVAEIS